MMKDVPLKYAGIVLILVALIFPFKWFLASFAILGILFSEQIYELLCEFGEEFDKYCVERGAAINGKRVEKDFGVRYPVAFHTVDAAITRPTNPPVEVGVRGEEEVLLIQKHGETSWRFPGGFVDPGDFSAEFAVKREATEETGGMETGQPIYLGSFKIDDPRYRNSPHKIITSFFELRYLWGHEKAGDDAAQANWFKLSELKANPSLQNPIHKDLFEALFASK